MKQFKKVYIEIANVCNLACSFCPQTQRRSKFMTVETFRHVLHQLKPHTRFVYFHVKGEPLLHPHIDKLLEVSSEEGFKVNITTNGTLINKAKQKLLLKPALRQMNFSLHSFDEQDETIRSETYLSDILHFAKEAAQAGVFMSLRLWNLHENQPGNLSRTTNRQQLEQIEQFFGLPYMIEEKVVPGKGVKLAERIFLNMDQVFQWPSLAAPNFGDRGFCHGLRSQAAVLVDGTVTPCCLDGEGVINLGSIHQNSFSEIIESERANQLFHGFSQRKVVEPLCQRCGYRMKFAMESP